MTQDSPPQDLGHFQLQATHGCDRDADLELVVNLWCPCHRHHNYSPVFDVHGSHQVTKGCFETSAHVA